MSDLSEQKQPILLCIFCVVDFCVVYAFQVDHLIRFHLCVSLDNKMHN